MTELVVDGAVVARAPVNIALIKYWGKAPARTEDERNLPAVPSLSLTLDGLWTETKVAFAPDLPRDEICLDGVILTGGAHERAVVVLDAVRRRAEIAAPFKVESVNHVPTAAGLASSASGMAALAGAAARCAGLPNDPKLISTLARIGSGSASRSIFEGWVTWSGAFAEPLAPKDHWDLRLVVAVIGTGPKAIGSRAAMERTRTTSPFYGPWVEQSRGTFEEGVAAVNARDFDGLVSAMEASTYRMHASAMGARPPILYWKAASLAAIHCVEDLRAGGVPCGWTMDAGPNVKVLCPADQAATVAAALAEVPGVIRTIDCAPGSGINIEVVAS